MADDGITMADAVAQYRSKSPADDISELFTVLATLGLHMVPLGRANRSPTSHVRYFAVFCETVTSPTFATRFDALDEQMKGLITCALLCAECYPMPIHYGFRVGVYKDWLWAANCWESGACDELDRIIAAVKDERKDLWLLRKIPTDMNRIQPTRGKIPVKQRKDTVKAREEMAKRLEKKGFPEPHHKSSQINAWWFPFAEWDSAFLLYNEGHSFDRSVRWQADPGRVLYAFIVDRELNLRDGELMLVLAGPAECLVRWLEGLQGVGIKVVPEVDLNLKGLGLSYSTRDTLHFQGRQDAYIIRDHRSAPRRPSAVRLPTSRSTTVSMTKFTSQSSSAPDTSPPDVVEMPGDTIQPDSALCVSTVRLPRYTLPSRPNAENNLIVMQSESSEADSGSQNSVRDTFISQDNIEEDEPDLRGEKNSTFLRALIPGGKT